MGRCSSKKKVQEMTAVSEGQMMPALMAVCPRGKVLTLQRSQMKPAAQMAHRRVTACSQIKLTDILVMGTAHNNPNSVAL